MKLFWGGILAVFAAIFMLVVVVNIAFSQNNFLNEPSDGISIKGNFFTKTERKCTDSFDKKTCVDDVIVYCNGESVKIPKSMTGYVVHDKVFVRENECTNEKNSIENNDINKNGEELPSPKSRIKDKQIRVYSNKVIINVDDAKWRKFIDSNSMDPLIDEGTKTIEIKPKNAEEIQVGDIISYNAEDLEYAIVHRVVEIGDDEEGAYFITKGDNFKFNDKDKIRFEQVEGIVVGVVY